MPWQQCQGTASNRLRLPQVQGQPCEEAWLGHTCTCTHTRTTHAHTLAHLCLHGSSVAEHAGHLSLNLLSVQGNEGVGFTDVCSWCTLAQLTCGLANGPATAIAGHHWAPGTVVPAPGLRPRSAPKQCTQGVHPGTAPRHCTQARQIPPPLPSQTAPGIGSCAVHRHTHRSPAGLHCSGILVRCTCLLLPHQPCLLSFQLCRQRRAGDQAGDGRAGGQAGRRGMKRAGGG